MLQNIPIESEFSWIFQTEKRLPFGSRVKRRLFVFEELVELVHKGVDILELTVNGSETHIAYLVDILELVHRKLADLLSGNLTVKARLNLALDFVYDILNLLERNGTLFARPQKTVCQLVSVKALAALVALDDNYVNLLDCFVGCEPLSASEALPAAADTLVIVG